MRDDDALTDAVLAEFNFDDGVVNAGDEDARRMASEIAQLREVLVFADGAVLASNMRYGAYDFVLADLYNDTTPLQGVIRRAGCHERGKFLTPRDGDHSLTVMHGHDRCSCGWEGDNGQEHMADVIHALAASSNG